jgi:hypothetical protein
VIRSPAVDITKDSLDIFNGETVVRAGNNAKAIGLSPKPLAPSSQKRPLRAFFKMVTQGSGPNPSRRFEQFLTQV